MISGRIIILSASILANLTVYAWSPNDSIPIDTLLLDDGSLYMGQIQDSLFNGYGTCIYTDGTVYEGGWKDGLWNGQGTLVYPDGDIYKGDFRNHVKEGTGIYIYASGARYEGRWKNDRFNGYGKLRFEDGGVYDGEWKDDMKHGYGKLVDAQRQTFAGYFYYDEYLGMPPDTKIDQDSTLTEELKAWGFEKEEPYTPPSISFGVSLSTTGIMTASLFYEINETFFWGLSMGADVQPPTKGIPTSMGWYQYPEDIHFTGSYISSVYMVEAGLVRKNFAIGGSIGKGFRKLYSNCKANVSIGSYFDKDQVSYGEAYHRTMIDGMPLVYRGYLRYSFHIKKEPKAYLYLGYGKPEELFLGLAFQL